MYARTLVLAVLVTAVVLLAAALPATAARYEVNATGDASDLVPGDGVCLTAGFVCTLRAALEEANAHPNPAGDRDRIEFKIPDTVPPVPGPHAIRPADALPPIEDAVVIDGYSQPGARANTQEFGSDAALGIQLDGPGFVPTGLSVLAQQVEIQGLWIRGFFVGIELSPDPLTPEADGSARIQGCRIEDNGSDGIQVTSNGNLIGGATPATRNVISGNGQVGVRLFGNANIVNGNYVGTDPGGSNADGNSRTAIYDGGVGNAIVRNVASGAAQGIGFEAGAGIELAGADGRVAGNRIGTDAAGSSRIGNFQGIFLSGSGYTIGGPGLNDGNVISGNQSAGIELFGSDNRVEGNFIGTGPAGAGIVLNVGYGIHVTGSDNAIGGLAPGLGNVIRNNDSGGIVIERLFGTGPVPLRNAILSNQMARNSFSRFFGGIDLVENSGVAATPNDLGDLDEGPNRLQNFPDLADVVRGEFSTRVRGTLDSAPGTYTLQFFSSTSCAGNGHGEGETLLGTRTLTLPLPPPPNDEFVFDLSAAPGIYFASTATDQDGNTSEYGPCIARGAENGADLSVHQSIVGEAAAAPGDEVAFQLVVANAGPLAAVAAALEDTLAPGLEFVSADPPWDVLDAGANRARWELGDVSSGAAPIVVTLRARVAPTLVVMPDAPCLGYATLLGSDAVLDAVQLDHIPQNDSDHAEIRVRTGADLRVVQSPAAIGADPGETVTLEATVTNAGPEDALGVIALGTVAGLDCDSAVPPFTSCNPADGSWSWNAGDLASGAFASVRFDVRAQGALGAIVPSSARVAGTSDPVCANNLNTAEIGVGGVADLEIVQIHRAEVSQFGFLGVAVYATVRNNGPARVDVIHMKVTGARSQRFSATGTPECPGVIMTPVLELDCFVHVQLEPGDTRQLGVVPDTLRVTFDVEPLGDDPGGGPGYVLLDPGPGANTASYLGLGYWECGAGSGDLVLVLAGLYALRRRTGRIR